MLNIDAVLLLICCGVMAYIIYYWYQNGIFASADNQPQPKLKPHTVTSNERLSVKKSLDIAGLKVAPLLFFLVVLALTALAFMVVYSVFAKQINIALIAASSVFIGCFFSLIDLAQWQIRRFETGLVDALETMNATLVAGLSGQQAIQVAQQTAKGSVKTELTEIITRMNMGYSAEQSLARLTEKYRCDASHLFAQTLITHSRTGCDLHLLLKSVALLMQQRLRQRQKVLNKLSGTRYAALFSGVLPYVLIPIFLWQQPNWFDALLNHPQGGTYLSIALVAQLVGFLWLRRSLRGAL
ncbi:type II secretion system F family protein [Pseudoalteromonas sp.]|uniref:type II secretion system F family protein n=1 Tax=Pseudoalteromonas sp. TaxID=53249 RepID=UPI0035619A14